MRTCLATGWSPLGREDEASSGVGTDCLGSEERGTAAVAVGVGDGEESYQLNFLEGCNHLCCHR